MSFKSIMVASLCAMALFASCGTADANRTIVTEVPERPAGQTDMLGFAAEPMDSVRIGVVGLGMRGADAANRLTLVPGARVTAICDIDTARINKVMARYASRNYGPVATYGGEEESWKQLCEDPNVDLVYVVTDWKHHTPIALYAMEQGKHTAIEVPAASTLEEIWDLINTSEKTRKHCMMLENCVYDFFELTTLNMAQQGLFGDILHVEGSYIHNLEDFWNEYEGNWRLDFNEKHRGDVYATHGMGPAAQLVNLHRGNKMNYLVAMDTKAVTGPKMVERQGRQSDNFQNGDHTMTMIMTENGQTMHIQHDVMNPRPYSRMYQLTGTDGFANKYPIEGYCFRQVTDSSIVADHENLSAHDFLPADVKDALLQKYKHPIQIELEERAKEVGGHGGMDYIMDSRLVYCLLNGLPLDQDVYDAAEWSSLGELTRISLENNSAPVEVPDFTRGAWNKLKGYHHYMKGE